MKYTQLQKKLEDEKKKDGVEQMKAEVAEDQTVEKNLAAETEKLQKQLTDAQAKEKSLESEKTELAAEDQDSSAKLHDLLSKMQSAISTAEAGLPKDGKALVQLDPSPVTDKTVGEGVPEQGFEGAAVEHKDMETVTGDWGKEYSGKKKVKSGATAMVVGALLLFFA